jgi:hypothetical protein
MPSGSRQSLGVYENDPGSGIWYARLRVNGKLVRKSIGTKAEAIAYVEKARMIRRTGAGILPTSARYPALTIAEMEKLGCKVTVAQLCDTYLAHLQEERNPNRPTDQMNPAIRIRAIHAKFGDRAAGSIHSSEIKDWLISLDRPPATLNKYQRTFSAIYQYGREQEIVHVNPVQNLPSFQ